MGTPGYRTLLAVILVALSLSACSQPRVVSVMGPSGSLAVLDARADLNAQIDRGELFIAGHRHKGAFSLTRHRGEPAIRLTAGAHPFAIAREIDSLLLNTPFLEWTWSAPRIVSARLPILILAGLARIDDDSGQSDLSEEVTGLELPDIDYLLIGEWTPSDAAPGTAQRHPTVDNVGLITVRQSGPDFGLWHVDGIDLYATASRLWPASNASELHIRFVALAILPSAHDESALISQLTLHR